MPANQTAVGDEWCVSVKPHDGQYSGLAVQTCIIIRATTQNLPPVASNAWIQPGGQPSQSENLRVTYVYSDSEDPNSEYATRIRWYRNNQLQPAFSGFTDVAAEHTKPGDVWYVTVEPQDGELYGDIIAAPEITINSPPQLGSVELKPLAPDIYEAIGLVYDLPTDPNNDPLHPPEVRWYRNGVVDHTFDDQERLSGIVITPANTVWFATIAPNDGIEYGGVVTSNSVTVQPPPIAPPQFSDVYLPSTLVNSAADLPACREATGYEDNDNRTMACTIVPDVVYRAQPNDIEDVYYFYLDTKTHFTIEMKNYQGGDGQLLLYYSFDNTESIAAVRELSGDGTISSRQVNSEGLSNGFYIRVYTYDGQFRPDTTYELRLLLE